MGIEEGICSAEHWLLYVNDESLNSIPENNIIPYVHWTLNKNMKKKRLPVRSQKEVRRKIEKKNPYIVLENT